MKISTVSVGMPQAVEYRGKIVQTGIFKSPVAGSVTVNLNNLQGDGQADLTAHGGRDKAIYVYPQRHYAYWSGQLGAGELEPAQFGENLAVSGVTEKDVVVGASYRIGSAVLLVTQPRIPCFKLGIRVGDKHFPGKFLRSGRLGFYMRVEKEGVLRAGDEFVLNHCPNHGITVHDLCALVSGASSDKDVAERALQNLPLLDSGWVRRLKQVLRKSDVRPTD